MALRAVLNRSKPWTWSRGPHQGKSGFVGAINGNKSSVKHNFLFDSRRHYYLPPPPPLDIRANVFPALNKDALPSAKFAVMMHNETEGRDIRFVRLVRASQMPTAGPYYHLILEGIDENGELNVYYAQVYDRVFEDAMWLKWWELVDESFRYPYRENRISNPRPWNAPDLLRRIMNFEENVRDMTNSSSSSSNDDIDPLAIADVVPVYNVQDYRVVLDYALFAVEMLNKKGNKICLEEVLFARTAKVNDKYFYMLFLEAMDENKEFHFFYAMLKVPRSSTRKAVELIKWHAVDKLFYAPLENDQMLK